MITVFGASGFIGSRLVKRLGALNMKHQAIRRNDRLPSGDLGHLVYCIGLTADFRSRPLDTVDAHVCRQLEVLRKCRFESLLYLSSTRIYGVTGGPTHEGTAMRITPLDHDDLYNVSKTMGEALALNSGRPTSVVRMSNVYGDDFDSNNFLSTIITDAIVRKRILFRTAADSAKDYISIDDVVDCLIRIATTGKERIYNLASGVNVSHGQLAETLRQLTGCSVEFAPDSPSVIFPPINIDRLRSEFGFEPSRVLDDMPKLVDLYRRHLESPDD